MPFPAKEKTLDFVFKFLFALFLASVVFSLRAITSISIALILVTGLVGGRNKGNLASPGLPIRLFVLGCLTLYFLKVLALLYTSNSETGIRNLQKTVGIVALPLALVACRHLFSAERFRWIMSVLLWLLVAASVFCVTLAISRYYSTGHAGHLFYHELVKPLGQHAIQFSLLLFYGILYLFLCLRTGSVLKRGQCMVLILFFSVMIFLLSSKLVILVYALYLCYFLLERFSSAFGRWSWLLFLGPLVLILGLVITISPLRQRFVQLASGNHFLFTEHQFSPATYFNGIQFRLLQWRLTGEILNEDQAWLLGVSSGDAQDALNRKYVEKDMYLGGPGDKSGYWNYHTHNQFLQVTLQNGLLGLAALVSVWVAILLMARKADSGQQCFLLLLFLYAFSDAALETQYGIVIFIFFPLFSYLNHRFILDFERAWQPAN